MKNILCLDFDGVIVDSIDECLLTAYNSYWIFENQKEMVVQNIEEINTKFKNTFFENRYLVRPAKEYWVLINMIVNEVININYDKFIKEIWNNEKILNSFEKIFFSIRNEMINRRTQEWLSLHRIYPEFSESWKYISNAYDVYIVTNKNSEAVYALLNYFKIEIQKNKIYTTEKFISKNNAVVVISSINNVSLRDILFVDDSPSTVEELMAEGVNSYLAIWGYYNEINNKYNILTHLMELNV